MKAKSELTLALAFTFLLFLGGCKEKQENVPVEEPKVDLINDEFPEAEQEVKMTMDSISKSAQEGNLDKLISFHAYSPKFTEFKNGELRNDGEENEKFERSVFGSITEVLKFDMNNMKVAAYGDVANVTLHTDFHLKFGEDLAVVNDQMTLLFVKTKDGWRIVHEHHSPLKKEEN